MSTFDELAAKQSGRVTPTKSVEVVFGGENVVLEFTEIDGRKWADITARHPMREGVYLDANMGYNWTSASLEAAVVSGVLVSGEGSREQLSEENWEVLIAALDGNSTRRVADAIWTLNEWEPANRVGELKKKSQPAGPSRRKRS